MESLSFTAPHSCCLYHTNEEQATIVTRFLHRGLTRQEKVLCIINPWDSGGFLKARAFSHDDVNLASAIRNGQLTFPTTTDTYLQTTPFNPEYMIQTLHQETVQAIQEGYAGLRVTADMTWTLHHNVPLHTLLTYEMQIDAFLRQHPCMGLCRYDRFHFSQTILEDIVPIHASIFIGDQEYTNTMYNTFGDLLHDLDTRT